MADWHMKLPDFADITRAEKLEQRKKTAVVELLARRIDEVAQVTPYRYVFMPFQYRSAKQHEHEAENVYASSLARSYGDGKKRGEVSF